MKVKQILEIDDTTYIFTENPEEDIKLIQKVYQNEEREAYMGYDLPELTTFKFLETEYPCISFWHDNEDIRPIQLPS